MSKPHPIAQPRPRHGAARPVRLWPALALAAALTSGCATQQPAGDEASALTQRLDHLERTLAAEGTRHATDIERQQRMLAGRTDALERRAGELDTRLGALQDAVAASERRLASIEAQAGQERRRIDELAAQTRALESGRRADSDGLGERLAQSERQAQTLATRLEQQARQLDDAATRLHALEANQRAGNEALAGMAARQQHDAAGAAELARRTGALETRQAAAATDSAALAQRMAAAEERLRVLSDQVQEALALASKEIFLAMGREAFTVTLTEDRVLYPLNDPNLDPRDLVKLNDLARRLGELDQEYHLDIQGHTDNTSTDDNNYNLGKARAEVVRRHLAERKGIPVNRMSTSSYGANKPLDPSGRNNRRIHIRVLVLK
jgi:outer membrane protein OmpA-like peptidoglycan-associated protein